MNIHLKWFCAAVIFFALGCTSVSSNKSSDNPMRQKESSRDAVAAMKSVASSIGGEDLTEEDMRDLAKQIEKDEEAQSAIETIADSIVKDAPVIKYCPTTGKRYSAKLKVCPIHEVELKIVEE